MSIEKLQEKIRKMKNPSIVDLTVTASQVPPHILQLEGDPAKASKRYCFELLEGLKGIVPAVRFSYSFYALMGAEALCNLQEMMTEAKKRGYYVLLDSVASVSVSVAEYAAKALMDLPCDGVIVSAYAGSDVVSPFVERLKETGKSLFVVVRNANKSAAQLQDLMTGSRLVHMATADMVKRFGENRIGRSGYSQVAGVCAATSADSVRSLRSKYPNMFLLLDGYDFPSANAKNCSFAFDKLGHGAAVCAGESIVSAWKNGDTDAVACAVDAAERMRKNLTRYTTIL